MIINVNVVRCKSNKIITFLTYSCSSNCRSGPSLPRLPALQLASCTFAASATNEWLAIGWCIYTGCASCRRKRKNTRYSHTVCRLNHHQSSLSSSSSSSSSSHILSMVELRARHSLRIYGPKSSLCVGWVSVPGLEHH